MAKKRKTEDETVKSQEQMEISSSGQNGSDKEEAKPSEAKSNPEKLRALRIALNEHFGFKVTDKYIGERIGVPSKTLADLEAGQVQADPEVEKQLEQFFQRAMEKDFACFPSAKKRGREKGVPNAPKPARPAKRTESKITSQSSSKGSLSLDKNDVIDDLLDLALKYPDDAAPLMKAIKLLRED